MSQHATVDWTLDRFLAWEDRQELRHEFDGHAPVAMTGGSWAAVVIQRNLSAAMTARLRGRPCQFAGVDMKVQAGRSVRYPDGLVVCRPVPRDAKLIPDPVVVFEIISPSTARTDKIIKLREYHAVPTIQRYVMLEQDFIGATDLARGSDAWLTRSLTGDDTLALPEIGVDLPLIELYEGLDFPEPEDV